MYLVAFSNIPIDDWRDHEPITIPDANSVHHALQLALEKTISRETFPNRQRLFAYVASDENDNIRPSGVPLVVHCQILDLYPE